jgi:hypothetical protein
VAFPARHPSVRAYDRRGASDPECRLRGFRPSSSIHGLDAQSSDRDRRTRRARRQRRTRPDMVRTPTSRTTVAVAIAVVVAGAALWLVGIVGVGRSLEDICFDDLDSRTRYGAYHSEGSLWPPSLECQLVGSNVEPIVVQHRLEAVARFGAVVVFPVLYGLAATLALTRWSGSRSVSRPAST